MGPMKKTATLLNRVGVLSVHPETQTVITKNRRRFVPSNILGLEQRALLTTLPTAEVPVTLVGESVNLLRIRRDVEASSDHHVDGSAYVLTYPTPSSTTVLAPGIAAVPAGTKQVLVLPGIVLAGGNGVIWYDFDNQLTGSTAGFQPLQSLAQERGGHYNGLAGLDLRDAKLVSEVNGTLSIWTSWRGSNGEGVPAADIVFAAPLVPNTTPTPTPTPAQPCCLPVLARALSLDARVEYFRLKLEWLQIEGKPKLSKAAFKKQLKEFTVGLATATAIRDEYIRANPECAARIAAPLGIAFQIDTLQVTQYRLQLQFNKMAHDPRWAKKAHKMFDPQLNSVRIAINTLSIVQVTLTSQIAC